MRAGVSGNGSSEECIAPPTVTIPHVRGHPPGEMGYGMYSVQCVCMCVCVWVHVWYLYTLCIHNWMRRIFQFGEADLCVLILLCTISPSECLSLCVYCVQVCLAVDDTGVQCTPVSSHCGAVYLGILTRLNACSLYVGGVMQTCYVYAVYVYTLW